MTDKGKTPPKTPRAEALEKALRDNLRRRKAAQAEPPAPGDAKDGHEKASGNGGQGA